MNRINPIVKRAWTLRIGFAPRLGQSGNVQVTSRFRSDSPCRGTQKVSLIGTPDTLVSQSSDCQFAQQSVLKYVPLRWCAYLASQYHQISFPMQPIAKLPTASCPIVVPLMSGLQFDRAREGLARCEHCCGSIGVLRSVQQTG